jgi:hypothetical protein
MARYTILRPSTHPEVRLGRHHHIGSVPIFVPGELVATHRKVHLFDIDIPGKITFKVSCILYFVATYLNPGSGERDADGRLDHQLF